MTSPGGPVRIGAICWNQYTDWPSLLEVGRRAERLGYDTLFTWDHLLPIVGSADGPIHEGWTTLTAWAMATERIRIGLLVGANTFRVPTLTAKLATQLDHVSGGRAILGIGAAWFRTEHEQFGIEFGDGPPERLRWLGEALPVIRGMLHGERPSASGPRYTARSVRLDPPPVQERLPILIGGGGERVTLRLVARYADANNLGGGFENVRRKEAILLEHCERVGRDPSDIERTVSLGGLVIRDSRDEAKRVQRQLFEHNGRARVWDNQPIGTPEDIVELCQAFVSIGYRHLIAGVPAPYDEESMTRFAQEVRPRLEGS